MLGKWRSNKIKERNEEVKDMKKIVSGLAAMAMTIGIAAGEDQKITVEGSTTVGPIAKAFAEYYMGKHPNVNITVSESGSGNGAKSLVNATCDVATMSRPMKSSEMKAAKDAGVLPIENIVAMDGIAAIVHQSNPVANLTVEQLRDIYTGKIKNWKEIGGPDQKIVVISRDTNSGTYECFESMVMNKEKMADKVEYVGSNGAARQRVLNTPAAVAYVGLAFTEGVKAVKVNNIEATPATVAAAKYPVSRPLYMYTNRRPKEGTALHDFISLSGAAEGKKLIEDKGYVPLK
jgi:phosphate transport system substrate-binding protein